MENSGNRNWNWVVGWLVAFIGFPPGGALATAVIGRLDNPLEGLVGGALAGLVIGAAGWLALRRRLPLGVEWIAATAVGLALGVALNVALFGTETTLQATLMRAPLTGLIVGVAQWWVLRRHVPRAYWWIPAMTVIYVIAWFITAQVIGASLDTGFVIFGASGALVHQALTGLLLWALLR